MQQSFQASNSSFNNLRLILSRLDTYNTIVLTEDYAIDNSQEYTNDPVRLTQNLLITSAPGQLYQMSFSFLVRQEQLGLTAVALRPCVRAAVHGCTLPSWISPVDGVCG
jgi:hypothetical protein